MNLIPNDKYIIVRRELPAAVSDTILAPDQSIAEATEGIVVISAIQKYTDGQRLLFGKYAGTLVKVDGEELVALEDDDIIGTFAN